MDDLISRQAAIDEVHRTIYEFFDICDDDEESPMTYKDEKLLEINKAISIRIRQLPSAERHGRWNELPYSYECSVCGIIRPKEMTGKWHYCPNCGAKMDEEEPLKMPPDDGSTIPVDVWKMDEVTE